MPSLERDMARGSQEGQRWHQPAFTSQPCAYVRQFPDLSGLSFLSVLTVEQVLLFEIAFTCIVAYVPSKTLQKTLQRASHGMISI